MTEREPHWATQTDEWGQPKGRYYFTRQGWCCRHCGGLFRGKRELLAHQDLALARTDGETTPEAKP